jgi:hypothetical protein
MNYGHYRLKIWFTKEFLLGVLYLLIRSINKNSFVDQRLSEDVYNS